MKRILNPILLILYIAFIQSACSQTHKKNATMKNEQIINTAFFYIKDGQHQKFEKLRSRGNVLLEKYGAKIERVIRPKMIAVGDLALPDEIHFAVYPNQQAFDAFNADPEFIQLKKDIIAPSVEKMFGFTTKESDFKFTREIGDHYKTYGVALVYIKEGQQYVDQFAAYHDEACAIIPEFGTHFERFLIPTSTKGAVAQPSEIHRFYFESQEGMQHMTTDERMLKLFPKRDASLENLIFIIGEAIQ